MAFTGVQDIGVAWLIGTDALENNAVAFLRHSCCYFSIMKNGYSHLHNRVHAENGAAIRWLAWLGFALGAPQPHGPFAKPFIHFEWRSQHV